MSTMKSPKLETESGHESPSELHEMKKTVNGALLVPQPSDDPRDPLNWPTWRKYATFITICIASFVGLASGVGHSSGIVIQAKTYGVTTTQMAYSVSSGVAGLLSGPFFFTPLARVIGPSSLIFWSLIGMIACGIWSGEMTHHNEYDAFVVSRLFGGMFGAVPQIVGNKVIVDMFFLHQRGRAFALYSTFFTLGVVAGPTFDGFIIDHVPWPNEFWWLVGVQGLAAVLALLFLEETSFDRENLDSKYNQKPKSWLKSRVATFLPGTAVLPQPSLSEFIDLYVVPFKIFFSPVTVMIGIYSTVNFGWGVVINTLLSTFLQTPEPKGYGFSPQQNAELFFSFWIGCFFAELYGGLLNDWIPMRVARRQNNGVWKPEYRLHTLWLPTLVIMPIGLGLFGSALQYHLPWIVLAIGTVLINFAVVVSVPVPINYLVETFRDNPQEVGTSLNVWRLLLGLFAAFFIGPWEDAVGVGWVFGMAAFFSIAVFGLVLVLMWKGPAIRQYSLKLHDRGTDDAIKVVE